MSEDAARGVHTEVVFTEIDLDAAPASTSDAYLRLHLISARLAEPRSINLDGVFGVLPNVVWTSAGPCAVEGFEQVRAALRVRGGHHRVRRRQVPAHGRLRRALGCAHRGRRPRPTRRAPRPGTTVMHEGFVNFNAGTLGTSMIEGRVSAGVIVGDGTDVGGGNKGAEHTHKID